MLSAISSEGRKSFEFGCNDKTRYSGLVKTITTAFKLLTNKEIKLPSFSVTSTLPNIDAMLCQIALRLGDFVYADEWYRDSAPRDTVTLKTMKRYQYLTQAMVELAHGDYDAVLLTLAPLETFCAAFKRNIDMIENP